MSHCSIGTEATGGRSHKKSSERSVSGRDTRSVKRKWPMANRWPTVLATPSDASSGVRRLTGDGAESQSGIADLGIGIATLPSQIISAAFNSC